MVVVSVVWQDSSRLVILSADLFMLGASRLARSAMVLPDCLLLCTLMHGMGFLQV